MLELIMLGSVLRYIHTGKYTGRYGKYGMHTRYLGCSGIPVFVRCRQSQVHRLETVYVYLLIIVFVFRKVLCKFIHTHDRLFIKLLNNFTHYPEGARQQDVIRTSINCRTTMLSFMVHFMHT